MRSEILTCERSMSVLIVVNVTFDSLSSLEITLKDVRHSPLLFDHIEKVLEMLLLFDLPLATFLTL